MLMFHVDILFYSQQVLKFNTMKLKFIADMHMIDLSVIQITCFAFSMLFTYIMACDHVKRQNSIFCVKKEKKKKNKIKNSSSDHYFVPNCGSQFEIKFDICYLKNPFCYCTAQ